MIGFYFRKWFYNDCDRDALLQMLDLSIKAGRRVVHDLDHCISDLGMAHYQLDRAGIRTFKDIERYKKRSKMWHGVFYPLKGMKDYRAEMFLEQLRLESEIRRLEGLCKENGIDPTHPDEIPF